jgi:hypothetical protein
MLEHLTRSGGLYVLPLKPCQIYFEDRLWGHPYAKFLRLIVSAANVQETSP